MKSILALLLSLFATAAVAGVLKVDQDNIRPSLMPNKLDSDVIDITRPNKVYAFLDKDELEKIKGALLELIKVDGDGHVICSTEK